MKNRQHFLLLCDEVEMSCLIVFVFLYAGGRLFLQLHANEHTVVFGQQAAERIQVAVVGHGRYFCKHGQQLVGIVEQADGIARHDHFG